jgi:hypothetical protein
MATYSTYTCQAIYVHLYLLCVQYHSARPSHLFQVNCNQVLHTCCCSVSYLAVGAETLGPWNAKARYLHMSAQWQHGGAHIGVPTYACMLPLVDGPKLITRCSNIHTAPAAA